jgi:hypothetical protein
MRHIESFRSTRNHYLFCYIADSKNEMSGNSLVQFDVQALACCFEALERSRDLVSPRLYRIKDVAAVSASNLVLSDAGRRVRELDHGSRNHSAGSILECALNGPRELLRHSS